MAHLHTKSLHDQAKGLLGRHGDAPKKLVLLHTVLGLGVPLLVMVINFLLEGQIAKTGGLGGMAARSTLETVQSLLETGVLILLPFWEMGLVFAALSWRKGHNADKSHLMEGFRRFVNIFALRLWSGVLFVIIGISVFYASMFIFTATPWAKPVMELVSPTGEAVTPEQMQAMLTPELTQQLLHKMLPMFILFLVLYAAVCIPLFYRLRFANFILLEGEGGIRAMAQSLRMTKGGCLQICKLDLHFWWFYLLQILALALCYGDSILALLGVSLPMGQNVSFFVFYSAGMLLEGILFWQCQGHRLTTYALAYDAFQDPTILPDDILQEA